MMPLKFADLHLSPELQANVTELGFDLCTPIQEQAIRPILEGQDVAGLAQTGTGKTAAFLLPLLERMLCSRRVVHDPSLAEAIGPRAFADWQKTNFVLVLVPTRELAEQVFEHAVRLSRNTKLQGVSVYGGVAYDKQKQSIREGVQFVVATPGRLIDLYKEHIVDLRQVRAVVFDEADRMFDMGFKDDMKYILQRIPRERQFMVFSATLNFDVINTAYQFGAHPVELDVSRDQPKAENVTDSVYHVGHLEKPQYLLSLLRKVQPNQTIVFTNFKSNVGRISSFLNSNDLPSVGISSLLTQAQRNRVMEQFKGSSDRNILVATDVAARGLDIKGVDLVINYDLPDDPENYVHRIGRTGRAGQKGIAFSMASDRDVEALERIEKYLEHKVPVEWLDDADIVQNFAPLPREHDRPPRSFDGPAPRGSGTRPHRPGVGRGSGRRPARPHRDGGADRENRVATSAAGTQGQAGHGASSATVASDSRGSRRPPRSRHRHDSHRRGANAPSRSANHRHHGSASEGQNVNSNRSANGRSGSPASAPARRPEAKAAVASAPAGIKQKVSKMLKRLFKS